MAVVKPCCIGDCVMTLPVLQALSTRFEDAVIDVFVGAHSRAVFEGRSDVRSIQPVADIPGWRDLPRLIRRLRSGRYDLIAVLDRSRLTQIAGRLAGARLLLLLERGADNSRHECDLYLDTLHAIGVDEAGATPEIQIPRAASARAAGFLRDVPAPSVVMHPGGAENPGALMPSKRWPLDYWAQLVSWARDTGYQIALTGSPAERALCERLKSACGEGGIHVAAGELSLIESAALIDRSCLYAGPDTGLSHIAAATGTPTVAIFGPTNPIRYGPRGDYVRVLALPASASLPDVDLRGFQQLNPAVSTSKVTVPEVIAACRDLLGDRICTA